MLCRTLREMRLGDMILCVLVCLAMAGGFPTPPKAWPEDETPTIGLWTPAFPLVALAANSPLRIEKQAQTNRLTLHKPQRSSHFSAAEQVQMIQPRPQVRNQTSSTLPRRFLPSRHMVPHGPDDSGDPFLS